LIDEALSLAEGRLQNLQAGGSDPSSPDSLTIIIAGLRYRRDGAINGRLGPSEGYVTLGLARAAAEHDRYDTSLMKKIGVIERYYRENL
jgi:hypothetical protein